jgi:hypothetical protein
MSALAWCALVVAAIWILQVVAVLKPLFFSSDEPAGSRGQTPPTTKESLK